MIFLTGSELCFGGLGALSPGGQGFHVFVAVLIDKQDIPVIVSLAQGFDGGHKGRRLLGVAGSGELCDTGDLHLSDEGIGKRAALVEQSFGHGRYLLAGVVGPDDVEVPINLYVLLPLGGKQQNVQALGAVGLSVDVNDHNNVFRHSNHSFTVPMMLGCSTSLTAAWSDRV